jgi:glycosyltransferase involved in cell wall biosynthesis
MTRIAIITPMYNASETIGETIDSVLTGTLGDWEWYLMDDGSTDATADIAEERLAREPRAHVVRNRRLGNIGTLRNRALEWVRAPYVCFLDADDKFLPRFLELQHSLLTQTRAHVAHTAATHIIDGHVTKVPAKYRGPSVCDPPEMLRQLYPRNPIYSPSVVMQTEVLRKEGGFSEHPDHFSTLDFDLWLRLAPRYRFAYNPEPLLQYRVSQTSLSRNPDNRMRNFRGDVKALELAFERAHELPPDLERLLRSLLSRYQSIYARTLLDETPPALDLSRKVFRNAYRLGPFASRYLLFQMLSLVGSRPPYLFHRVLRRFRG